MPKNRWPDGEEFENMIKKYWINDYGDRRQEMVFIGLSAEMDKDAIKAELDACLVKDYLSNIEEAANSNDPFPKWFGEAA